RCVGGLEPRGKLRQWVAPIKKERRPKPTPFNTFEGPPLRLAPNSLSVLPNVDCFDLGHFDLDHFDHRSDRSLKQSDWECSPPQNSGGSPIRRGCWCPAYSCVSGRG